LNMQANDFDAIVIGAGMAGASVAWFMAPQARVLVLEREAWPGVHATGRSAALFSETYGSAQVRALSRATRPFLEHPPQGFAEHSILTPRATLVIGSAAQADAVRAMYTENRVHIPGLRLLGADEVQAMVPVLKPEAAQIGMLEPDAADIDVNELHQGFLRGLRRRGGTLRVDVAIRAIERAQGQWQVDCGEVAYRAPLLLDAAGGAPGSSRKASPAASIAARRWRRA